MGALTLVLMGKYVLIVYSLKGKETHTYAQEIYMYVCALVHFSTYFVEASHKIVLLQWGRWLVQKKVEKDEHSIKIIEIVFFFD